MNLSWPLRFKRENKGHIDADYEFTTGQRMAYLTHPTRYAGQIVYDKDEDELYRLNALENLWLPVGSGLKVFGIPVLGAVPVYNPVANRAEWGVIEDGGNIGAEYAPPIEQFFTGAEVSAQRTLQLVEMGEKYEVIFGGFIQVDGWSVKGDIITFDEDMPGLGKGKIKIIKPPKDVANGAPVITLSGAGTITLEKGTTWNEPGASALDDKDGIRPVVITGTVNTAVEGTYTITYKATDTGGLSTTAIRTINVVSGETTNVKTTDSFDDNKTFNDTVTFE